MPINTVFQLSREAGGGGATRGRADRADPDLLGPVADRHARQRAHDRLHDRAARGPRPALGVRSRRAARAPGGAPSPARSPSPGSVLGPLHDAHARRRGRRRGPRCGGRRARHRVGLRRRAAGRAAQRRALLGHVVAARASSSTEPELGDAAAAFNLTNERGIDGTIRLLRNVMGLWLVQECRRVWEPTGVGRDYDELQALAAAARPDVALFDPDDELAAARRRHARADRRAVRRPGQEPPAGSRRAAALDPRLARLQVPARARAARARDRPPRSRSSTSSAAARATSCSASSPPTVRDRPVLAGPVEATALGNVLVQAMAARRARRPGRGAAAGEPRRSQLRRYEPSRRSPPPRPTNAFWR